MPQACLEKIPCGDDRVHERIGKGLFAIAGRQVKDDRYIGGGSDAILTGQKIAFDHFDSCPRVRPATSDRFDFRHVTRGPGETAHIAESAIQ